ncbi:MAG: tetratricopeptide repeat protein [Synergistaceae bacterium]|nr:tetratricopeptide repeat protein [Synergistaceae bacterium]
MNRQRGGFFPGLVVALVIILLSATALLAVATIRERNIVKAESLLRSGDYYGAAELLRKAEKFSLRPESRVVKGLAEANLGKEDYETATHYYEKLVKLEPDNVEARYKLGLLYIRAKDYGAAEKEVTALRIIGTESAIQSADALTENLSSGKVKEFFRDLLKKVAPGLPEIPGITQDEPITTDTEETTGETLSEDLPKTEGVYESVPGSGDAVTE